jgi:hypothetical protein
VHHGRDKVHRLIEMIRERVKAQIEQIEQIENAGPEADELAAIGPEVMNSIPLSLPNLNALELAIPRLGQSGTDSSTRSSVGSNSAMAAIREQCHVKQTAVCRGSIWTVVHQFSKPIYWRVSPKGVHVRQHGHSILEDKQSKNPTAHEDVVRARRDV